MLLPFFALLLFGFGFLLFGLEGLNPHNHFVGDQGEGQHKGRAGGDVAEVMGGCQDSG